MFYSPAAPPTEPDPASESTVFGTVLYCKSCPRYGVLREIRLQAACNSIAQPTDLSIQYSQIQRWALATIIATT